MHPALSESVMKLQGVGEERAKDLRSLGIETIQDLLEYFPYRYEDYRIRDLAQVRDGEKVTVKGTIYGEPSVRFYGQNKSRLSVRIVVDRIAVTAVWFNRHFLKNQLQTGREIVITGKWERGRQQITVSEHRFPESSKGKEIGTLQPVYSTCGSLTQAFLRRIIRQALARYGNLLGEILPAELVARYKLMPRREAIARIHFPEGVKDGVLARRRFVYEEFFLFQLKMQVYRKLQRKRAGVKQDVPLEEVRRFIAGLPFSLTAAQKTAVREILRDMMSPHAMNRLLQGDVGSGKTVVAVIALYATVKAGYQGALMVPTEILAEQHFASLKQYLSPFGVEVALLSGSATARQRKDILAQLQTGLIDVIVGTHALIQEDVFFARLGLVVIDEQHRFGVEQRKQLRKKGLSPDVLVMTATPIPRTLAIAVFGDMDVSTIDELPAGRKKVETYWVKHALFERVLHFMGKELAKGRQAYVICPLIEESEKLDVQNALDLHARLTRFFPQYRIGLLHGKMSAAEKEEVMRQFSANQVQVLVSTTVVEVGVNVPNATVMVIYDAERFGLAQLHQLRGRVGRGSEQSYCILVADPKTETGKERMRVMSETADGFEISRRDLVLRGPGDFFGTKQSGLPEFKVADLVEDFQVMEWARRDVNRLIAEKAFWQDGRYAPLREYLRKESVLEEKVLD
ncbi:ATP-dependent DNA helicase RecG [Bacillaceae bacterium]